MNKWVKRKWLRALKSGEYQKGAGWLGVNRAGEMNYCCLGVLVEEMVPEFVKDNGERILMDGKVSYLPDDLATLWGLDQNTQTRLANLNDKSDTFAPVIDYIEKTL